MSIDYAAIADEITAKQYVDVDEAYASMSAETMTRKKPGEVRLNRRAIMRELGVSSAASLVAKIFVGIDNSGLDAESIAFLKSEINHQGLDLNHPQTQGMLQSFVGVVMTQAEADSLMSLTNESVKKWPDISIRSISEAIRLRAAGDI